MDLGKLVAKHNLTPTPDKTVDKGGKNVVGVGDTLNYEIKTDSSATAPDEYACPRRSVLSLSLSASWRSRPSSNFAACAAGFSRYGSAGARPPPYGGGEHNTGCGDSQQYGGEPYRVRAKGATQEGQST